MGMVTKTMRMTITIHLGSQLGSIRNAYGNGFRSFFGCRFAFVGIAVESVWMARVIPAVDGTAIRSVNDRIAGHQ